jgi:hypothetical protein
MNKILLEALKTNSIPRHPHWNKINEGYLKKQPKCVVCGISENVVAHHIYPMHLCSEVGRADLELDERNLITLCENGSISNHHLLIGHLGSFESYNPEIDTDVVKFKCKKDQFIKNNITWMKKNLNRPKAIYELTILEKRELRKRLDELFPLLVAHI